MSAAGTTVSADASYSRREPSSRLELGGPICPICSAASATAVNLAKAAKAQTVTKMLSPTTCWMS